MTREEALDKLCHSYSGYFDVVRHEEPKGYLVAEAGLHIHSEKYVLVKAAIPRLSILKFLRRYRRREKESDW